MGLRLGLRMSACVPFSLSLPSFLFCPLKLLFVFYIFHSFHFIVSFTLYPLSAMNTPDIPLGVCGCISPPPPPSLPPTCPARPTRNGWEVLLLCGKAFFAKQSNAMQLHLHTPFLGEQTQVSTEAQSVLPPTACPRTGSSCRVLSVCENEKPHAVWCF